MSERVERFEDMSPRGRLVLHRQDDGDIIVSVMPDDKQCDGKRLLSPFGVSAEFCTVGSGGGQSPHTRRALTALWEAIELDNKENPQHRE